MASELYSGSETVGTTEWSLTTDTAGPDADTTPGTYVLVMDVSALAAGDQFQVCVYEKATSGGTQRLAHPPMILTGAQSVPVQMTPEFTLIHGWDFTLKKLAGTDRAITWSIRDTTLKTEVAAVKADTAAILVDTGTTLDGRIPASLTADGFIKADSKAIAGVVLQGTGVEDTDEWRPA